MDGLIRGRLFVSRLEGLDPSVPGLGGNVW